MALEPIRNAEMIRGLRALEKAQQLEAQGLRHEAMAQLWCARDAFTQSGSTVSPAYRERAQAEIDRLHKEIRDALASNT